MQCVLLGVNACVLRTSGRLLNFLLSSGEVFARYSSSGSQPSSLSFSRMLQIDGFSKLKIHRVNLGIHTHLVLTCAHQAVRSLWSFYSYCTRLLEPVPSEILRLVTGLSRAWTINCYLYYGGCRASMVCEVFYALLFGRRSFLPSYNNLVQGGPIVCISP